MKEKILEILTEFDDEIVEFTGDNLFDEGLMDSLTITLLVARLQKEFNIDIDASYIVEENFKTVDAIIDLVRRLS